MRDEFDEVETIDRNPKSWVAWKREAERLQGIIDGMALAAIDSEPVEENIRIADALEGLLWPDMALGNKAVIQAAIEALRTYHAQPAPDGEQLAIENFRSAMEGIGHIRRTLEETFGGLHGTYVEPDVLAECKAICDAIYAAYGHAQPAPVVPEEMTPEMMRAVQLNSELGAYAASNLSGAYALFAEFWKVACRASMLQAGNSPVIPDGSASMLRRWLVFGRGMQNAGSQLPHNLIAETEEMLAAADCSIPMISDTWIPVSERMPEEGGRYWCYVEEQNSLGKSHYQWNCSWNGNVWSDKALTGRVTHWMPLPAAPQEVKGES
ncbi:DUF551 domain-containing protein [Raoultella ornithinolytica]|uniref:DUF551 domain-containing protein n=1 Tax=Raoultella ornithinolytica TaxID=54291 RepID=A0A9Q9MV44_RAOOR|nr:DUF551 domain-containing protein [Raoultella ornithinolytica]UXE36564.1 DUF551 domain-containing protein [Raoultella ornithinolytica]